jgi:hypothetical protein
MKAYAPFVKSVRRNSVADKNIVLFLCCRNSQSTSQSIASELISQKNISVITRY